MQTFLGVDFGVTTTVVSFRSEGQTHLARDSRGCEIIPSVIAFPPSGEVVIGEVAKQRRTIDAGNTFFAFKRVIGEPRTSVLYQRFIEQYPFFRPERGDSDANALFKTRVGPMSGADLAARFLSEIRAITEVSTVVPRRPVVGVPSTFRRRQRLAIVRALKTAGFADALLVEEPLAIAWAYISQSLDRERTIAVYDLGGGTFDFALCEVRGGGIRLIAAAGDEYLGGEDIDRLCADWVVEQVLRKLHWDIKSSDEAFGRLLLIAEKAKILLSTRRTTTIHLDEIEAIDQFIGETVELEREVVQELTTDLVRRTFVICDEILSKVGLSVEDVEEVFLAGGSSLAPWVGDAVESYFGKAPRRSQHPEHLVSNGAALIAEKSNLS